MINRVILTGRLTKDVEVRKTNTGLSTASFSLAVDRRTKDTAGQSQADFPVCIAWRQSADFLGQYAHKGTLLGVEGRLQTRTYDRPDGTKAYVTEVICENVNILNNYSNNGGNQNANTGTPAKDYNDLNALDISNDDLPF